MSSTSQEKGKLGEFAHFLIRFKRFLRQSLMVAYFDCFRQVLGDIYLVCELMETDLSRVIRSRQ